MKKYLLIPIILIFITLPCLVTAKQANSALRNLAGTTWAGTDSKGDYYEYTFETGGILQYKSPTGVYRNGTWKQTGNEIYMETNKKYSERQGVISGNIMEGKGWNTRGLTWTWKAKKQ